MRLVYYMTMLLCSAVLAVQYLCLLAMLVYFLYYTVKSVII